MKRYILNCLVISVLCTFILPMIGCGPKLPDGFPRLYPVTLKVAQEGTPLADAVIALRASDNSMAWACGGTTDAQGMVVLWTHGKYEGAPAGKFKVMVSKFVNEGEKEMLEAADKGDFATANKIPVNSFTFVKPEYEEFEKTPIEIEITNKSRMIEVDAGPAVKEKRPYMRQAFTSGY